MVKIILKPILAIILGFSILVILKICNEIYIKKNFIPITAEVTFFVNTKISKNVARTKLTVEYILNGETRKTTIIAPIYDYKVGSKIIIYINPKDENDIRVP